MNSGFLNLSAFQGPITGSPQWFKYVQNFQEIFNFKTFTPATVYAYMYDSPKNQSEKFGLGKFIKKRNRYYWVVGL